MAITWTQRGARTVQAVTTATTESAPTLSTEGVSLVAVQSVLPFVAAPDGQTFDGTGVLRGYIWSDYIGQWVRAPQSDIDMTDADGEGVVAFPAIEVGQAQGRFALIPDGIGVSGGTALTLTLIAAGSLGESAL